MTKFTLIALSVCGGVLLGLAWTDWCPGLVLLFSFVPFFIIENHLYENKRRYSPNTLFIYLLPGFVIFSILTLGWIRVVSMGAAIAVILTASILMATSIWLAHKVRLREGDIHGYVSFIAFWLSLELICLKIPVLSPWIILGNGLSKDIRFIQWYEVTGVAGGSLWILLSNLFLFLLLNNLSLKNRKKLIVNLSVWLIIILVPSIISLLRYRTINPASGHEEEVIIVQPNFDPYKEKFTFPFDKQLGKIISKAEPMVSESTSWIVTPETTIDDPADENFLNSNKYVQMIRKFVTDHPNVNVVAGMASYSSAAGRQRGRSSDTINYFNSAVKIDTGPAVEIYHKSKLVPGFELIPSGRLFSLLTRSLPELGSLNRGYSVQVAGSCFLNTDKSRKIAPVICYESVFGAFTANKIRDGAGAIFVITNDGWWKNTNGYKHHLSYASLRAIETRRPVIRSANTGISCFIDIRGKIIRKTEWWVPDVIKGTFAYEDRLTPYVRFGDYLMYMASVISIMTLIMAFIIRPFTEK